MGMEGTQPEFQNAPEEIIDAEYVPEPHGAIIPADEPINISIPDKVVSAPQAEPEPLVKMSSDPNPFAESDPNAFLLKFGMAMGKSKEQQIADYEAQKKQNLEGYERMKEEWRKNNPPR